MTDHLDKAECSWNMSQVRRSDSSIFAHTTFQERILEALERERDIHDRWRNMVIAATGTSKNIPQAT
jgi:hypothetical protein